MTIRRDRPVSDIAWNLMAIILIIQNPDFGYKKWSEKQEIVSFLVYETSLAHVVGGKPKEIWCGEKERQDSENYLARLGFPAKSPIKMVNGEILVNNKLARRYLSTQEYLIFKNLYLAKHLTIEQISNLLWSNDPDKFSLWAITKLISRLRAKLKNLGVSKNLIMTERNRGHFMSDT